MQSIIISVAFQASELMQKEVFWYGSLTTGQREPMRDAAAICFLRPTMSSLDALKNELKNPHYASYDVYFANSLTRSQLEFIAKADTSLVIRKSLFLFRFGFTMVAMFLMLFYASTY